MFAAACLLVIYAEHAADLPLPTIHIYNICKYVRIYTYVHGFMYECMSACKYVCMHININLCMLFLVPFLLATRLFRRLFCCLICHLLLLATFYIALENIFLYANFRRVKVLKA